MQIETMLGIISGQQLVVLKWIPSAPQYPTRCTLTVKPDMIAPPPSLGEGGDPRGREHASDNNLKRDEAADNDRALRLSMQDRVNDMQGTTAGSVMPWKDMPTPVCGSGSYADIMMMRAYAAGIVYQDR